MVKLNLLEGNLNKTLLKMSSYMLIGMMSIILFNVVDTIYVGKLGTEYLAAISFTFPVIAVIMSITFGISMGVTTIISHYAGKKEFNNIQKSTTYSLILAMIIYFIICLIGYFTINPLFTLLGATPESLILISSYMKVWYLGSVLILVPIIGNSSLRALGDTKTPSIIMMISGISNIILDPLFIFGIGPFPRLELQGAAIATVLAYAISLIFSLSILIFREKVITLKKPKIKEILFHWKEILKIGIPNALTNSIVPISTGILTALAANYGKEMVAAFGVGARIEQMVVMISMAFGASLMPIIGQNVGAKKVSRAIKATKLSIKYVFFISILIAISLNIFPYFIARIFTSDYKVIELIIRYIWIVPLSFAFHGIAQLIGASANAVKKPLYAAFLIILRVFILAIPLAYFGSFLFQEKGIFIGISLANILTGIIAFPLVRKIIK